MGKLLLEGGCPRCVEVNRVGQHEPRQRRDHASRNQILNPAFRLVADPIVNDEAASLWCPVEIQESQPGAVVLGQDIEELGQE